VRQSRARLAPVAGSSPIQQGLAFSRATLEMNQSGHLTEGVSWRNPQPVPV